MTTECVQVRLEIGHKASIRAKETPEGFTHDWTVFVRGPEGSSAQHFVERVVFQLHESFPKPKRVVKEPPYQVSESGYAGFILPIEVVFKNKEEPKKVLYNYDLYLQLEGPPINPARIEKLTFHNPTEDFRRKLIKAGGVGVLASEGGTILNHPLHIPSKLSPAHSSTSQSSNPSGTYKKQISEAIKAPKSSTGQSAVAPTDGSSAPRQAFSSSSSSSSSASSSPTSPVVPASAVVPVPTTLTAVSSIFAKKNRRAEDDVLKSVTSHSHIPTSFVDLFGQPIKRSRCRSPEPSKVLKDQHHKSSSLSSKSTKPSTASSSSSSTALSSSSSTALSSSATSKENVAGGISSSSNRSSGSSSKGPKTLKASVAATTGTTATTARTKESKSQNAPKVNSSGEKRPPSPPPSKAVESSKKRNHLGSKSPPLRPFSSSKAKDLKDKKGFTIQDKEKNLHKNRQCLVDIDGVDVRINKERKFVEEKNSTKGLAKNLKRVKCPPSSTPTPPPSSNIVLSASDGRVNPSRTTSTSPPHQRSPLVDANDVADASPSSSISFSSLPGHGGGGSGPLGALMAELVDEDDFLSPLSSDAETPIEADPPTTPSPPLPPPPPPPSPPPRPVAEKQKLKEKKISEKNDLKATKTVSDSTFTKKSSSVTSKVKVGHLTEEAMVTSGSVHVVSTTDERVNDDYIVELRELQERIMAIKDRSHLQRIVNVIEETGLYQVTSTTFDFDLCTLDRNTVKKLQTCLAVT